MKYILLALGCMFITGSAPLAAADAARSAAGAGGGAGAGADGSRASVDNTPLAQLTQKAQSAYAASLRALHLAAFEVEGYDEKLYKERLKRAQICAQKADKKGCAESPLILINIDGEDQYERSLRALDRGNTQAAYNLVQVCPKHPDFATDEAVSKTFYRAKEIAEEVGMFTPSFLKSRVKLFEIKKRQAAQTPSAQKTSVTRTKATFGSMKHSILHSMPDDNLKRASLYAQKYNALTDREEKEEAAQCFTHFLKQAHKAAIEGSVEQEASAHFLNIGSNEDRARELAALDMKAFYAEHART